VLHAGCRSDNPGKLTEPSNIRRRPPPPPARRGRLAPAIERCGQWWNDVTLALQRFRFVPGATAPWGLMLHMTSYGRDEGEARKFSGVTLERLAKRIARLPNDLRWAP
jgi:hypothetical protein